MERYQKEASTELTARERQVVILAAQGADDNRIGLQLNISQHTVGGHLKNIFAKLEIHNRWSLTLYALRQGLVSLDCDPKLAHSLTDLAGSYYESERRRYRPAYAPIPKGGQPAPPAIRLGITGTHGV